ncbi:MAG: hypothetical protein ACR2PT_05660 [Endozoicomonas sp.]
MNRMVRAGALVKRSCQVSDGPAYFFANFSLSHLCRFMTYLLAGWSMNTSKRSVQVFTDTATGL